MKIGIINYGAGNIRSLISAIAYLGYDAEVINDPFAFEKYDKFLLPGVGAFSDAMDSLKSKKFIDPMAEEVLSRKKLILGICLGAHLLTKSSSEFGFNKGLCFIDAEVKGLNEIIDKSNEIRIPHVGWDEAISTKESTLFGGNIGSNVFYYAHSYALFSDTNSIVTSTCNYGTKFIASYEDDNIMGVQFHPEKSQKAGLNLLNNFLNY